MHYRIDLGNSQEHFGKPIYLCSLCRYDTISKLSNIDLFTPYRNAFNPTGQFIFSSTLSVIIEINSANS